MRVERELFLFFFRFFLIFMKIGPQVFVGAEGKVDLRDESYAWTPKVGVSTNSMR